MARNSSLFFVLSGSELYTSSCQSSEVSRLNPISGQSPFGLGHSIKGINLSSRLSIFLPLSLSFSLPSISLSLSLYLSLSLTLSCSFQIHQQLPRPANLIRFRVHDRGSFEYYSSNLTAKYLIVSGDLSQVTR